MFRTLILCLGLCLILAGCQKVATRASPPATTQKKEAAQGQEPAPPASASKVARIVFLDKQEACACTETRIGASWEVLTKALGTPPKVKVERVHMDTDPMTADPYVKMRPVMVAPAVYFLGPDDKLLEVLQGELTAEKVKAQLGG